MCTGFIAGDIHVISACASPGIKRRIPKDQRNCLVAPLPQQEIAVLSHCHCPQLTQYHGSYVVDTSLWIVMEYLQVKPLLSIEMIHIIMYA